MAILLRSPNSRDQIDVNDPYTKDRMEMLSALYFDRVALGWAYVGYHFCVGRYSGASFEGRDLGLAGAHVQKLNERNIGICLLGNTEQRQPGIEYDTTFRMPSKQIASAERLIDGLSKQFQIDKGHSVVTHNFLQCKNCCLLCNAWLRNLTGNPELTTEKRLQSVDQQNTKFAGSFSKRLEEFRQLEEPRSGPGACLSPLFPSTNKRPAGSNERVD